MIQGSGLEEGKNVLDRKPHAPASQSNHGIPVNLENVGVSANAETSTQSYNWKTSGGM